MEEILSLADLLDLQAVDLEIDRLLADRQSLPELARYKRAHEHLADLTKERDDLKAALRETVLTFDRSSGELEIAISKLDKEQNRLYAGGISAREAENLRLEVDMLGRRNTEMEDQILELMEVREQQEKSLADLEGRLVDAEAEKNGLGEIIAEKWKTIDAELARKEARKANIIPLIDGDLLEMYEELRRIKEGVAVGRLVEGMCGGCHLRLTAAEELQVSHTSPTRCPHCRRLLVL